MRYNAMVVKIPNCKTKRFKFSVIYGGLNHGSVIGMRYLYQLLRLQNKKLHGVRVIKTNYGVLRIVFYGDKELDKFFLEANNGDLISFKDYININLMMGYEIGDNGNIFIENDDYINNTEINFVMYNNTTVFSVRK